MNYQAYRDTRINGRMGFYLHAYKCAGTSIGTALETAVGLRRFVNLEFGKRFSDPAVVPSDALVFGPASWGIHRRYAQPPRYAVTLRDPIERAWSFHKWVRLVVGGNPYGSWGMGPFWQADKLTVGEMAATGLPELNNRMTAMLAGRAPSGPNDYRTLNLAIEHLNECDWVGVVGSDFDLPSLSKFAGASVGRVDCLNTTGSEDIPDADAEVIAERNGLDIELVRHARTLCVTR